MAVAGVVVLGALGGKLLGSRLLRTRVQVLDLGLAENAVTGASAPCEKRRRAGSWRGTHMYVLLLGDL